VTTDRKLTARSVILSVLLGTDPPRLPTLLLVRTTALFGIAEGTTRTALSRMVAAGELATDGRRHAIADQRLVARQARQAASRAGRTNPWDGTWHLAVVGADGRRSRAERDEVRAALQAARFAEQREGVWLRPDNLDAPGALPGVTPYVARPSGDPAVLAGALWDLAGWSRAADDLRTRMRDLAPALEAGDTGALAEGFVVSAGVLRLFQHDPLLPEALLADDWPGGALRREYEDYDRAYRTVLQRWFGQ
jgi:phenylacetic acid degradation operon negative regulatory protein